MRDFKNCCGAPYRLGLFVLYLFENIYHGCGNAGSWSGGESQPSALQGIVTCGELMVS